ncbi:type II toxin-antitoxin system VapC family toxin [Bacteroidota bacterium]
MILFFDTSALVKLFNNEQGSEEVTNLIIDPSNEVVVLELAQIEIQSAIYRKIRSKEIGEDKLEKIQEAIDEQFEIFTIIPFGTDIIEETKILIKQYGKQFGLRTLDALHVAAWSLIAGSDWQFVSSDKNQLSVVEMMNFSTLQV